MSRPIHAAVSLAALRHNYWVAKRMAPRAKVYAVVKANAYGHGVERVARALDRTDGFATLELDGAVALRDRHATTPILLLEGFFEPSEIATIATCQLATVVHCGEQLRMLETQKPAHPIDFFLKINTGMNRLGFAPAAAKGALERLEATGAVRSVTLMTHFASADAPEGIREAMRRFEAATAGLKHPRSLANSAAIFAHPAAHGDVARFGIGLYAPCMAMVSLLGMSPITAFPVMMGSCACLMPVASIRFLKAGKYDRPAALGLAIGGVPGVLIAAFAVKSLPLDAVRVLVIGVITYTAARMWRDSRREAA